MAVLTRGQQRTYMSLLMGDSATTNPEMSDTEKNALLDEWHAWVWEAFGPRLTQVSNLTDGGLVSSNGFLMTTGLTTLAEILSVHFEGTANGNVNGSILDRIGIDELLARRAKSTASSDTTKAAAWWREQDVDTPGNVGMWKIGHHPPTGATEQHYAVLARLEVTAYTGDGSTPDVTPSESRLIARGAAVEACVKIGRVARANKIARLLPEVMLTALGLRKAQIPGKIEVVRGAA